ncbi:hypothetical protein SShM2_199 [Synechococcus phage S-ShM2]|uniref:Uncharacterized protein n=1 Tax=Synechococcus phage S-ShM2 TaxID=445683 RepID=E3SJM0_9CAUD|nr:hypothetical protein SShM2_199 [Synechococcus phage S-ShM2]ADO97810.1 hypothetical protein SShM2_199 [Synechococcus phage S-ShM2]
MGSFRFFDDFNLKSPLDSYIDKLQDLLAEGRYDDATVLSSQINNISGVSSSVDRASHF